MEIIDHGEWEEYDPGAHWLKAHNVIFAKRVSDGVDWYVYQRQTDLLTSNTVKMTIRKFDDEWVVQATQIDGSMLWPIRCRLIEFPDLKNDGIEHEKYRQNRFNFETRQFSEPPKMDMDRPLLHALATELGIDFDRLIQILK
jgi:hypothetical protein